MDRGYATAPHPKVRRNWEPSIETPRKVVEAALMRDRRPSGRYSQCFCIRVWRVANLEPDRSEKSPGFLWKPWGPGRLPAVCERRDL